MVTISGILSSMGKLLQGFVPIGIDPVYFWATLLISFGIIYLLLQLLPLFKESRGIAFIVAAVISYFVASSAFATIIIAKLFPNIGIAIMAILGLLMVIAFLSPDAFEGGLRAAPFIAIVAFIIVIFLTYSAVAPELSAAGYISEGTGVSISDDDVAMIMAAIIVIGIIWAIVGTKKPEKDYLKLPKWIFGKGWK